MVVETQFSGCLVFGFWVIRSHSYFRHVPNIDNFLRARVGVWNSVDVPRARS
jgi:hypothetical protein